MVNLLGTQRCGKCCTARTSLEEESYEIPRLEWADGRVVSGMFPVARFLATELGLDGGDDDRKGRVETMVEFVAKYYERKVTSW